METEHLFIIDAKNNVKIANECIDDVITKNVKIKKIRKNYKHIDGAAQFYKDTNYASIYYNNNKKRLDVPCIIVLLLYLV